MKHSNIVFVSCLLLLSGAALPVRADGGDYQKHELVGQALTVETSIGEVVITARGSQALEVHYRPKGVKQLPSYAIAEGEIAPVSVHLKDSPGSLEFSTGDLAAIIRKQPLTIAYEKRGKPLLEEESGLFVEETLRGFRFKLDEGEKLMGGGQRIVGMDRRGLRLPLYNQPHGGYTTESKQMYYSIPAVISSDRYLLLFDNSARGVMDLGASQPDVLQFEASAGRTAYLVVAGDDYPDLLANYTAVSGRQPLPPRWVFGSFASRFGYHSEQETRATVAAYREHDIPLDAIVLDLYWFGQDIKGHMGNLDWDREAFPSPEKMMADFSADGVNTVVITEPYVLRSSKRWDEAVRKRVLARNLAGATRTFDFFFGNGGIIDVFDASAADWYWTIYKGLIDQGVSGLWCDLAEPEAHPADTVHAVGTADEIHNVYGHQWAKLIHDNYAETWPARRPMILMRAGFAGSQRYGLIPWTGDVSRSWGGLKPQVELSLQMGLMGLAYSHSDLGGFDAAEVFDPELYLRWLQLGVFQPVFRPHAQEHIAPEPVYHEASVRDVARDLIRLRYSLLPYLYTLAWENASTGMPFARPLFFTDESDRDLIDYMDAYLWGDAFLVVPILDPGITSTRVKLPRGAWFDFFSDERFQGGRERELPVRREQIPVLVRAGAFVPRVEPVSTTRDYSTRKLALHYYADASVKQSSGHLYEDDGKTRGAMAAGDYQLLKFSASQRGKRLAFTLSSSGKGYVGAPNSRDLAMVVHHWQAPVKAVTVAGRLLAPLPAEDLDREGFHYDDEKSLLQIRFAWSGEESAIEVNP